MTNSKSKWHTTVNTPQGKVYVTVNSVSALFDRVKDIKQQNKEDKKPCKTT